jgi:hypothetical protein
MVGLAGAVALLLVTLAVLVLLPAKSHPAQATASKRAAQARSHRPFTGLGTWVDMYSWSATFSNGPPSFGLGDIDAIAASGVQTLYIQAASQTGPASVLEPDRLVPLMQRAHRLGVAVVVWYLPRLVDVADDMARLLEISRLPADGVAVDMESTDVADVARRNAALIALSQQLRWALPAVPLGAIVLPATLLEVVNTRFWPDFPYVALAPHYDAWLPMVYWTGRRPDSGFRDGYRYTADSVNRLRADLGAVRGAVAVNPIGGVSVDGVAVADLNGFVVAAKATGSVGGSLYEWPGTDPSAWSVLRALRS